MFKKIAAAVALIAASSASFAAEPPSFYAGVAASSTEIDNMDRDSGYGAFLGYKFGQGIAIEAGYYRVADTEYRSGLVRADARLDQADLSVIGSLPLSNGFDLYGRLGIARLEARANVAGYTGKEHDTNALYGLGLGYSFTPGVHGRLEVQKPSSDATKLVAGVAFQF